MTPADRRASRWVSVEERLPETYEDVQALIDAGPGGEFAAGERYAVVKDRIVPGRHPGEGWEKYYGEIVAWKPFSDPPSDYPLPPCHGEGGQ